jgi:hypothetical protein
VDGTFSTDATFAFKVSEGGADAYCKLDSAASVLCSSPFERSRLSYGSHTFLVVAFDAAGNVSRDAVYRWTNQPMIK